jgi:uncharacterized integral membrane protein
MRDFPNSFDSFLKKHNLSNDVSKSAFFKLVKEDVILRNDFAYLSLIDDLEIFFDYKLILDKKIDHYFPKRGRHKKWKRFQESSKLIIADLTGNEIKSLIFFVMFFIMLFLLVDFMINTRDLFAFAIMHPGTFTIPLLLIIFSIIGLNQIVKKIGLNKRFPLNYRDETMKGLAFKILTDNRNNIKYDFENFYDDKFELLKKAQMNRELE